MPQVLSIKLLNARPVWLPGNEILGEVHLVSYDQVDVTNVWIAFQGMTESDPSGAHDRISLFSLELLLFQGPFTFPTGSQSWPFRFVVPHNCGGVQEEGLDGVKPYREQSTFDISRDQMLPPTFSYNLDVDTGCKIEYTLQAVMNYSKLLFKTKKEAVKICIAQPRTREPEQFDTQQLPHGFSFHTLHLDTEVGDRKLTLREKMRTAFSPEKIPTANLDILVDLPQAVTADSSVNPILHLQHRHAGTSHPPDVTLMSFALDIKAEVYIRTRDRERRKSAFTRRLGLWSKVLGIPLTERFEVNQLFPNNLVMLPSTPTFQTFNIAVRYEWKVEFTIMCATKKETGKLSMPCIVLGPPGQIPGQIPMVSGSVSSPVLEEESLPAYTE